MSFTAPADSGGHTIIKYGVQAYTDSGATTTHGSVVYGDASPITVTGLTDGTDYYFTVLAVNSWSTLVVGSVEEVPGAGDGDVSAVTSPATVPGHVPGAATAVGGVSGDRSVTVSWTAPSDTGGGTIAYYTVFAEPPPSIDGLTGESIAAAAAPPP